MKRQVHILFLTLGILSMGSLQSQAIEIQVEIQRQGRPSESIVFQKEDKFGSQMHFVSKWTDKKPQRTRLLSAAGYMALTDKVMAFLSPQNTSLATPSPDCQEQVILSQNGQKVHHCLDGKGSAQKPALNSWLSSLFSTFNP